MKIIAFLFALLVASAAFGQGEVANHAVPIGKGPGVQGFGAAAPGAAGNFLTSNGGSADPSFQSPIFATVAQYYAGAVATAPIAPSVIYPAEVTVTFGATTTFDMTTFINASVTLTGNITAMSVNAVAGKSGMITFIQDGTGGRTTVWNTVFKFSGTIPSLSSTASAIDVLTYSCRSATFCVASLLTNVHNP
jgi:hypothetical protein